ncbi:MAG: ribosomal-protein-alanine N-acetyltransferase [Desulforhopalus sp.]|jgi:ribosomal-protein-alanine N-acetyltransferase
MLETINLVLKRIVADDIDLYLKMYKCLETTRYLPNGKPYSDEQIKELVEKRITHWESGFGTFTILDKSTSKKIGYVGVEKSPNPLFSDIRYGIESSERGKGYAVKAAIECLRFTFNEGLHEKIYGASVFKNPASINVLQRLGMVAETHVDIYGESDLLYFSISKQNFKKKYSGNG